MVTQSRKGVVLVRCEVCGHETFDEAKGECQHCHMRGGAEQPITEKLLDAFLHNVRLRLAEMRPDEFQQSLGMFGPRPGMPLSDGIPYTPEDCTRVQRFLLEHDILCAQVAVTADRKTEYSLVISLSDKGIERAIRQATKQAKKARARVSVIRNLNA